MAVSAAAARHIEDGAKFRPRRQRGHRLDHGTGLLRYGADRFPHRIVQRFATAIDQRHRLDHLCGVGAGGDQHPGGLRRPNAFTLRPFDLLPERLGGVEPGLCRRGRAARGNDRSK
jgi:hypothetical protein